MNFNFWDLPPAQWLLRQAKTYTFIGFSGISIYDIIRTFRSDVKQDMLLVRAGALTFNFMMSLFPGIIFLFTLLPYLPIKNLDDQILAFLLLPKNATGFVNTTIHDLVRIKRDGLLSTGFLIALFFASNSIMSLQRAFDKSENNRNFTKRPPLQRRILAIVLVFVLFIMFALALTFIVGGAILVKYMSTMDYISSLSYYMVILVRWSAIIILFYSVISIIFRYVPSIERKFPFFSGGAVVATLGTLLTSIGFSYFVNNFGSYNKVYGTVGTFIVLMLWFNLNAQVLLVGFEVNVAIQNIMNRRKEKDVEEYAS
jgi:membrane protein